MNPQPSIPIKANDCFTGRTIRLPEKLFGEYWLGGEVAMLFGPTGVGKSVLAVQIGDALARGRSVDGFSGSTRRRRVLYVDLRHSDAQFQARYSRFTEYGVFIKSFRFAERFYRGRPGMDEDIAEWVAERVGDGRFEAVIIDDLTAVKRTQDGVREPVLLMRRLRELRDRLRITVLVLTASESPPRDDLITEVQLKRSRVLCGMADSVFALSPSSLNAESRCLIHFRKTSGPVEWPEGGLPFGGIIQNSDGLVEFRFDNFRFPHIDAATRSLINRIHEYRQTGTTYRQIAAALGISKSRAARLGEKWRPGME